MPELKWHEAHRITPEGDQFFGPLLKVTPEDATAWEAQLNSSRTPEQIASGVTFIVKLCPMPPIPLE